MQNIFKNKNNKKGNDVIDKLITEVLQLLELVIVIVEYTQKL